LAFLPKLDREFDHSSLLLSYAGDPSSLHVLTPLCLKHSPGRILLQQNLEMEPGKPQIEDNFSASRSKADARRMVNFRFAAYSRFSSAESHKRKSTKTDTLVGENAR